MTGAKAQPGLAVARHGRKGFDIELRIAGRKQCRAEPLSLWTDERLVARYSDSIRLVS